MRRLNRDNRSGTNTVEYIALMGFILAAVLLSGFVPRACAGFNEFFNKVVEAMR